jgi:hypothetical protein
MMAIFIYKPREGDPNDTEVMRVAFHAGAEVTIDETTEPGARLAHQLRANPWFVEEVVGDPSHRQAGDP